ncbi:MAG: hypothetical protein JXX14_06375 [Deltaproteobacteria bacterium]|nr:hypothetical protein [Deltaproteobacteria bacterium]
MKIKNDNDLERAICRLDDIWSAQPSDANWEERCILVEEIEKYEDRTVDIPPPSPVDAILFRMEQGGLKNVDLIPYIGSAPKVSEVLSGKRNLSKEMIRKLHSGLGIPLNSLLGISDHIPEGSIQVQWVLPVDVVNSIAEMAERIGATEEYVAGSLLAMTVSAIEDTRKYTNITDDQQTSDSANSVVNCSNNNKLLLVA